MRVSRWLAVITAVLIVGACQSGTGASPSAPASVVAPSAVESAGGTVPSEASPGEASPSEAVPSAVASEASAAATTGAQPSQLTIAAVQGVESIGLKAVAPDYEAKTGVALEIVELPYPQLYEKLVQTFQANDSAYDLVMLDDPWMPKFGTDGSLQPLEPLGIEKDPDIAPVIYEVGTWPPPRGPVPPSEVDKPQELLGITIVGNVEMFVYRSDLTPSAPATWDDVLTNGQAQNKEDFPGYVIRGAATNPVVADFLPILWSFGGDVFDENWNVVIDNEASMTAVNFLVNDLKSIAQGDPSNTDAADRSRLIAVGEAYQSTTWPGEITGTIESADSTVKGKVSYIPIPAGPSGKGIGMMGNWLLAVPKASQNGQAAADFIKWMTDPATQKTYAEKGGIPSRTSILEDATLGEANPYFEALADSFASVPNWRPRTDQWNAVETALGTHLNAILAGTEEPEAGIKAAAEEIRGIMQAAGYPTQ
ncbi:MAG: extracellular solute-binding protein [Chloroflexi bacterium]|nr:extracellular solute-binding protein [Chloroflexota bacterium]